MPKVEWMYSGDDGFSHFETRELELSAVDLGHGAEFLGVDGVMIREPPLGVVQDFHCAPRRQFVLQLRGSMEIDCGNGEKRVIEPGDILLADDLTGKGHHSVELSGPRLQVMVYLPEDLEIDAISRAVA